MKVLVGLLLFLALGEIGRAQDRKVRAIEIFPFSADFTSMDWWSVDLLAEEVAVASHHGNIERIVELTHPEVIELNGGREQYLTECRAAHAKLVAGPKLVFVTAQNPVGISKEQAYDAAVFPIIRVTEEGKSEVYRKTHILALRSHEAKMDGWKILWLSELTKKEFRKIAPNFLNQFGFPENTVAIDPSSEKILLEELIRSRTQPE